ncbi:MAG: XylR N-terminal domain-containing protein [Thermoplasmata archaeon]|nr:MAG: XylR N-terminal domain-containing protein [Thermoplasmata archaeon]
MPKKGAKRTKDAEESGSFVSMPGDAITSLRSELSNLLGERLASGVLFRFGYRCGEGLAERLSSKETGSDNATEILPKIWQRTGLGTISQIKEISEDEMEVEIAGSTEALALGSAEEPICDCTRGYLAGVANWLSKKRFYCVEESCLSQGQKTCTFRLVVFPHKVYVSKKESE